MQGYIANFDEEIQLHQEKEEGTLTIYFSGSDFKAGRIIHPSLFEFQSEHLIAIKELRALVQSTTKKIKLSGGEPLLQRQAISHISHLTPLPLTLSTHCTKPQTLLYLFPKLEQITISIWYPLRDSFATLTGAGTFFKPADAIMEDIRQSYRLLQNYKGRISVHVHAHEQFAEKEVLEHTALIPWDELHLHSSSDYFHGFQFLPIALTNIQEKLQSSADKPVIIHDV